MEIITPSPRPTTQRTTAFVGAPMGAMLLIAIGHRSPMGAPTKAGLDGISVSHEAGALKSGVVSPTILQ
jgi:hypothetical protein